MRWLIVNADDFGATRGINRGILEAHRHGVVTSASLMVTTPWRDEAAALARSAPALGVGLHADLTPEGGAGDGEACVAELRRQVEVFEALVGRPPTHLDAHHNVHRDPRLRGAFLDVARELGAPLREHSAARYVSSFYGRWGGETHPEQLAVASLLAMLDADTGDGIVELGCHPGYRDGDLRSSYAVERELELRTLCDPALRAALRARGIALVGFEHLARRERVGEGRAS